MKLLIVTQVVDKYHPILGFFHRWIEEFAKHCQQVIVICLQRGAYDLPDNVKVLSLGKEEGKNKLVYLYRFYKYIWQERKSYDSVFVHMNPEYVVLAGLLWRWWGKKVGLWYVHRSVTWKLRWAEKLVDVIFTVSEKSCQLKQRKKIMVLGHGIDVEFFKRDYKIKNTPSSILYLGRISPIKDIETLIKAADLLDKSGKNFVLNIIGEPGKNDWEYFQKIKEEAKELEQKGKVKFFAKVPNYKTPEIYNQNEVLVNLTSSGSFDKVILEAMACEIMVLVANQSFAVVLPKKFIFKEKNPEDLKSKIVDLLDMESEQKKKHLKEFRHWVVNNHNLELLIGKIRELL